MMTSSFLDQILELKRVRVAQAKASCPDWRVQLKSDREPYSLQKALSKDGINIIAEIKRASPSKGIINDNIDVCNTARSYKENGACAISILTEEDRFKGCLEDLREVRKVVDLPLLRKDFIFDEFQIFESKYAGADAILLIVAMLDRSQLNHLFGVAQELGLDVLMEVHTLDELETAVEVGAKIIGVNNRNLKTFEVSLEVSKNLIKFAPPDVIMISESGISDKTQIDELRSMGFSGFLIGESLMRSDDIAGKLKSLYAEG
jgi:indole-3-glycerol phosphate synthase